jgi:hypothetical protein
VIEKIWAKYDSTKTGTLSKDESRNFIMDNYFVNYSFGKGRENE